jgi:SAM-dependent methyltransferase
MIRAKKLAKDQRRSSSLEKIKLKLLGLDIKMNLMKRIILKTILMLKSAVNRGQFNNFFEHYKKYGHFENRTLRKKINRKDKIFDKLDKQGLGLEIGPSHNPIAPKKDGFNVRILDHANSIELKKKYTGHGVNLENIEEVDYVWSGENFEDLVGGAEIFDWIIASHVIEHVPDLISFLNQCDRILKKNGKLSLVIPNKFFCFDHFSSLTMTGEILDAHIQKRTRPTPGQIFNHLANASSRFGQLAWADDGQGKPDALIHKISDAKEYFFRALNSEEYLDTHCWRFTPKTFNLILSDLNYLKLINLRPIQNFDTEGCEFFVTLQKNNSPLNRDSLEINRLSVLKDMTTKINKV